MRMKGEYAEKRAVMPGTRGPTAVTFPGGFQDGSVLVKNLPAVRETWVRSLGGEDPLEKGTATHSVFWTGEFHG